MVVTRSQQGDERPEPGPTRRTPDNRAQPGVLVGAAENVARPPPVLDAFLSSSAAAAAANVAAAAAAVAASSVSPLDESITGVSTEEEESTHARRRREGSARSSTLRPGATRSVRSSASRKKVLAELEAKERLAELQLKKAQAEEELQKLRLQRLQIEEEDEESEEDREDELESVRIQEWFKRTPLKDKETAQPPPEEKKRDAEEVEVQQSEEKTHDKTEESRRASEEKRTTHQTQPVVDVAALAASLLNAARNNREPPRYIQELPFFNGSSHEWLGFRAAYESSSNYFTPTENLARIRRSLRGIAKEAVGCLLLSQPDPKTVLDALERRFGRPEALIHAEIEKMKSLHKVTDNPRDLCIFAGSVSNIVGTIEALKKPHYLYNPELARIVVDKLTPILRNKWYDFAAKKKEESPEIKSLSIFLNEEADKCGAYALPEPIREERSFQERKNFKKERAFTVKKDEADYTQCPSCNKQHKLTECQDFLETAVKERWEIAKKNRICFRCLKSKHRRFACRAAPCGKQGCTMRHHKLLHYDQRESTPPVQQEREAVTSTREVTAAASHTSSSRRAYLKIIPVVLSGPTSSIETYALCDEGSTVTLVDASIADVIGADGPKKSMWLQGISSEMRHEDSKLVSMKIRGKYSSEEHKIEAARTVNRLDFAPETVKREDMEACVHLQDILDEIVYERASPKILLGQDNIGLIVTRELRAGKKNQPVASYTQLGWVLHGCQSSLTSTVAFCGHINQVKKNDDMEELIKNHFKLESLGIEPKKPREDPEEKALIILREKSRRLPDGRFETALPWRDENFAIPNNFTQAERRLHSLEKKLDRDEDLKKKYEERIDNLLKSGYAERVSSPPPRDRTWYLPHFPVVNAAKPHKPPRLVHDAAARFAGVSLNDMLLSGPDLLQSLPGVIMRFRQHPYAVSADLKEMFMQIKVQEEDRDTLRFLWRGDRREGKPDEYRMTSVIFGATSSPFTALYIKNRNAEDFQEKYPRAAAAVVKNHYMDDYLQSFGEEQEAIEIARQVDFVHKQAGFTLDGWASNSREIRREVCKSEDNNTAVAIGGKETEKALGLQWNVNEDYFSFRANQLKTPADILEGKRRPTKREALSIIMALFDPLGLISPITTPAKRIFQDTWKYKIDWDDPLPEELEPRWTKWMENLRSIESLRIPRCYDYEPVTRRQLHTFVDASEEAYAAAVYWRQEHPDGSVKVTLAAAKSRVTPTRPVSIPRLELQAALLGARLAQTVLSEHEYEVEKKFYWSDSRTALAWIRAEPRAFKSFVAHRLAEIEETTKKNEWRWIPTKDNVADDATRATPIDFDSQHRWFEGPSFLKLTEEQWPQESGRETTIEADEERKPEKCHMEKLKNEDRRHPHLPDIEKFSRWTRLIRTTARVLQFVEKLKRENNESTHATRKRTRKNADADPSWRLIKKKEVTKQPRIPRAPAQQRNYVTLPAGLIITAERLWVQASQRDSFSDEMARTQRNEKPASGDRLAALTTYVDAEGTLRLKGRVAAASGIRAEQVNPAILDGRHQYTRLYIQHVHEALHHGGVEMVVNELRQRVWIMKIRPTVRDVIRRCIRCRLARRKPSSPVTGDLPAARLAHHARPFTFTGLDYFGPIEVTVARHREKRYGALFTCMTSRAIHIEVAHSLSADSAIAAFRRFVARRGCPKEIHSDNATCFKAADKELAEAALQGLQHDVTAHQVKWRYIPPGAPFMGGAWERMVRAVKEALKTTLHERCPSDETLMTLLAEVENTVNSRPLTHVAVTPEEPEALTPNHILIGPNCHVPPPGHFGAEDITARQQWRRAQALADIFWQRWVREYLPLLQHRREPRNMEEPPKVGDYALIWDANLPRNTWLRGTIIRVYPGADGEVRVVDIQLSGGNVLQRPTRKVVVIPEVSPSGDGGRDVHDGERITKIGPRV